MWTREQLKTSAKDVLRRNYWMPFLASLLYNLMLSFLGSSDSVTPTFSMNIPVNSGSAETTITPEAIERMEELFGAVDWAKVLPAIALGGFALFLFVTIVVVLSLALNFLVTGPLAVGYSRY